MNSKRYAIWDKKTPIICPTGEVFTPDEWMVKYPVAKLENITVLCAPGEINGAFFGTLGQMKQFYESQGCDFSECNTNQEILDKIDSFEDMKELAEKELEANTITAEERIAAALEAQVMLSMPDNTITVEE